MASLTFTKFHCFYEDLAEKVHNLGADTFKIALTNTAPNAATDHQFSDITEISAGSGYTAGGEAVTVASSSQASGTYTWVASGSVSWTSSGTIGPFRYLVLYNDTATNDELIGYFDHGSALTLNNLDEYAVDVATTLLTLADA